METGMSLKFIWNGFQSIWKLNNPIEAQYLQSENKKPVIKTEFLKQFAQKSSKNAQKYGNYYIYMVK